MKVYFLIFLFLICFGANSQSPSEIYYPTINLGVDCLIRGDLDSSLYYYNKALVEFNYPFYRHIKQATIIAYYKKDTAKFKEYLFKCVERGMEKEDIEYFNDPYFVKYVNKALLSFESLHNKYLNSLDNDLIEKFLELDAKDYLIHNFIYTKSKKDDVIHDTIQKKIIKSYTELLKTNLFPTEKKIGLSKDWKVKKRRCKSNNCFSFKLPIKGRKRCQYYMTYSENSKFKIFANVPGNWCLLHYALNREKDSLLLSLLDEGFQDLKLSQSYIPLILESSYYNSDKMLHSPEYDFFKSSNSYFLWNKKVTFINIEEKLTSKEIDGINTLREKYHILSTHKEKELLITFYNLKFETKINKLTNNEFQQLSVEYSTFISQYNF